MQFDPREVDAHLTADQEPDSDPGVGVYSARYYVNGVPHASAFHSPQGAAEWLVTAERAGDLAPIGVVNSRTGRIVAGPDTLATYVPTEHQVTGDEGRLGNLHGGASSDAT